MIMQVASTLEDLLDHFVFVGGAVTDLLIEDPLYISRPTKDVDVITEISSYKARILLSVCYAQKDSSQNKKAPFAAGKLATMW